MQTTIEKLTIRPYLKSETLSNHKNIENLPIIKRMFKADYSIGEYRNLLEKMYGFYALTEPIILDKVGDDLRPGFYFRRKIGLLQQDLTQLGLNEREIKSLLRPAKFPNVDSVAASLGVWYVLEGSTLGGQFISRHLSRHFGDSSTNFMAFYRGYGEHTELYWKQFCKLLEDWVIHENCSQIQDISEAAKLTFDTLTEWLSLD